MHNLQNYLRIKEAAEFLGVSPGTLRNWDRAGKIPSRRHPISGYRLFKKTDLEAFLHKIEQSIQGKTSAKEKA
jgi:MerR family copper efflux transcriptional regulator